MSLDKAINTVYSFGAAVVIFGAWGKIEHINYSDTTLTVGMLTESVIFCLYAVLEWRKRPSGNRHPDSHLEKKETLSAKAEVGELNSTVRQTNRILNKIFRTE